jgi:hypothetical protein
MADSAGNAGSEMRQIELACWFCGQKLRVPEKLAGTEGRCPKCKGILHIPAPSADRDEVSAGDRGEIKLKYPADGSLKVGSPQADEMPIDVTIFQQTSVLGEPEPPPERRLPWLVDIFAYPFNLPGLYAFGIIVGIPLLFSFTATVLRISMAVSTIFMIPYVMTLIIGWLVRIVILFYAFWFICECISDSCEGQIRVPETIGRTPGLGEIFFTSLKVQFALLLCMLPVIIHVVVTRSNDLILRSLVIAGLTYYPMALLAIVRFDTMYGMNPALVLGSILSTIFHYCGLLIFFFGGAYLMKKAFSYMLERNAASFLFEALALYAFLVGAHLLGRFYFRLQDRLNWDA